MGKGSFAHSVHTWCMHFFVLYLISMWSIIITSVSGTPHGVPSRSCRPQEKGIVTEVGAEQRRQSTLNSGKTRPCFPAESAHYKRQYKSFPQVSTTPWPQREWMERTKAWAKPQRQIPNLANKHQPWDCQLRTQMYTWSVLFFSPLLFCSHSTQTVGTWSHYSCCSESSAKGTKKKEVEKYFWEDYPRSPSYMLQVHVFAYQHLLGGKCQAHGGTVGRNVRKSPKSYWFTCCGWIPLKNVISLSKISKQSISWYFSLDDGDGS